VFIGVEKMSFHWDTPDFWVRRDVDDMLQDFEATDVGSLADSFERTTLSYDGGPEMARAVLAELRLRQAAGVVFWPANDANTTIVGPNGPLMFPVPAAAPAVDEDDIPW